MKRRTLLQLLLSVVAALPARIRLFAQSPVVMPADEARLRALADIVLPGELGAEGKANVVAGFLRWLREHREGVDTDHGYGFTRLRRTTASPARNYAAQLDALAARSGDRRVAVEEAIAAAKIERLPPRPDGGHVATDLMSFYFNSAEATDRAYGAAIRRDACRELAGSENRPAPIQTGVR